MKLHYSNRDYEESTLNELLFSEPIQESIREKLGMDKRVYSRTMNILKKRGLVLDNKLNEDLTNYPKNGKFDLHIKFNVDKEEKTNTGSDATEGQLRGSVGPSDTPRHDIAETEERTS